MTSPAHTAEPGRPWSAERWAPVEVELWSRWETSLGADQHAKALLPLQAALSGLVAFRHLVNHPLDVPITDFRPHLHALRVTYDWALELVAQLPDGNARNEGSRSTKKPSGEPQPSLRALDRALADALRVSEELLKLPLVDASAFGTGADLFLRALERNAFFRPLEPLEFPNVADSLSHGALTPELATWKSEDAKMTIVIAFMTLLRAHRFLGVADRQIGAEDGVYRAHVVISGVRRELRALTRFLLVRGVETFADELEARLLSFDANQIAQARAPMTRASNDLKELRDSVETVAVRLHAKVRSALDGALPALHPERGQALAAERMRNGIREVRATVKESARHLRNLGQPLRTEPPSSVVAKSVHQEIWAFRFILRAFVAKASVAPVHPERWSAAASLEFVAEFVGHFRVFGPHLTRATDYPRRVALTRAVSALSHRESVDAATLRLATRECALFLQHLEGALAGLRPSLLAPFDKDRAAADLRAYLSAAQDRGRGDRREAKGFGAVDVGRVQAG
ncbi:MAG: hypothetical protein WCE62_04995 [Polyangiales bacterium]